MRDPIFRHLLPFPVPDSGIMDHAVEWSGFVCGGSERFGLGYAGEVTDEDSRGAGDGRGCRSCTGGVAGVERDLVALGDESAGYGLSDSV